MGYQYFDIYASIAKIPSSRLIISLVTLPNLFIHQVEFHTLFIMVILIKKYICNGQKVYFCSKLLQVLQTHQIALCFEAITEALQKFRNILLYDGCEAHDVDACDYMAEDRIILLISL